MYLSTVYNVNIQNQNMHRIIFYTCNYFR